MDVGVRRDLCDRRTDRDLVVREDGVPETWPTKATDLTRRGSREVYQERGMEEVQELIFGESTPDGIGGINFNVGWNPVGLGKGNRWKKVS